MKRWALPLLVAIDLALLAWLAARWITPQGEWIGVKWTPPAAQRPSLDGGAPLPQTGVEVGRFVATLERPLFVPTRRPPPPPQAASAPAPADPLTDLRLLAVYGNQQVGGVIVRVDSRVRRLKLGETLNGWTLRSVQPHAVELARGDEVRSIEIKRTAGLEPQPTASGAPVAGEGQSAASNARSAALEEMQRREREERRAQITRMNAIRARMGAPPLPEP